MTGWNLPTQHSGTGLIRVVFRRAHGLIDAGASAMQVNR